MCDFIFLVYRKLIGDYPILKIVLKFAIFENLVISNHRLFKTFINLYLDFWNLLKFKQAELIMN